MQERKVVNILSRKFAEENGLYSIFSVLNALILPFTFCQFSPILVIHITYHISEGMRERERERLNWQKYLRTET